MVKLNVGTAVGFGGAKGVRLGAAFFTIGVAATDFTD